MSYEIELKAHVYNREQVIETLNGLEFGEYLGHTEKSDTYYHFAVGAGVNEGESGVNDGGAEGCGVGGVNDSVADVCGAGGVNTGKTGVNTSKPEVTGAAAVSSARDYISARIRKEKLVFKGEESCSNYFTYKRKEVILGSDGREIEVNDEKEINFGGSAEALEVFFTDLGGKVALKKEKSVEQWILELDGEKAHVELCTVPPLGDFLEIEIIKDANDEVTVARCKKIEEKIFTLCHIPLEQIEPRYYSQMLKEAK